jgi:glycosyltransferase involved in cell wall biosynthesis
MKAVTLVSPYPVWGAAEQYVLTLADGLAELTWDVRLLINADVAGVQSKAATAGVPERRLTSVRGATALCAQQRRRVLHVNQASLPLLAGARAARAHPTVVTLHTPALESRLSRRGRFLQRLALPAVDRWIVLSERNKQLLSDSLAVAPESIVVIPPGLSPSQFSDLGTRAAALEKLGIPIDALVVGTIGRLAHQKRHDVLIRSVASIANPRLHLVIVGSGELEEETRLLAREELGDRVTMAGNRTDAISLLAGFDVFAMSSDFEGLPFALLEAMAASRAIVTTDVQGAGEAVRDGKEGLLVPRRDPGALAAAIVRLSQSKELADHLARAACERFQAEFTAARMVDRTEALYLGLLDGMGAGVNPRQ